MGERLVIKVKRNDQLLSTIYYHWSAYSEPAINLSTALYQRVLVDADKMSDDELRLALIRFAELTTGIGHFDSVEERENSFDAWLKNAEKRGDVPHEILVDVLLRHGGLDPSDRELATKIFPNEVFETEEISRNEGLVAISMEAMSNQLKWAEGTIDIDLDTKLVLNDVLYSYDEEGYLAETEDFDDDEYVAFEDLPKIPIDIGEFQLEDIELVKELIALHRGSFMRYEETVYEMKEG